MILILLLLALFGLAYGSSSSGGAAPTAVPATRVPTVTGLYLQYADQRVEQAGLVAVHRWCTVPAGQYAVARQRPGPGSVVPRGTRVRLFLVPALGQGVRHPACRTFVASRP